MSRAEERLRELDRIKYALKRLGFAADSTAFEYLSEIEQDLGGISASQIASFASLIQQVEWATEKAATKKTTEAIRSRLNGLIDTVVGAQTV